MALRSVVVDTPAAPPPPRRTLVIRAGAPAPKGHFVDVLLGVVGAILLIGAIVLAGVLPDKTYLNPQFRVSFPAGGAEFGGSLETDYISEGAAPFEFKVPVPVDNVTSIQMVVGFSDDIYYSGPDRFQVDLFDPSGAPRGRLEVENPAPTPGDGPTAAPQTDNAEATATFPIAPVPSEQIVTGLRHTEVAEQVQARVAPDHHVRTAGEWTVRVTLVAAADCPDPGQGFDTQALVCRTGPPGGSSDGTSDDGSDPGNTLLLSAFTYSFYTILVEELN